MNFNYHTQLTHEDEYKAYCSQQSLKVIDSAIEKNDIPLRSDIFIILLKELAYAPFYIVRKTSKIILHTWNFFTLKVNNKSYEFTHLKYLYKPYAIQCCIPFICTAIRVLFSVLGLVFPFLALYGWQLAEKVEMITFKIWSINLQKITQSSQHVYAEIIPSNAIFYFGLEKTKSYLNKEDIQKPELEKKIRSVILEFLNYIASSEPYYFRKLLYYDWAINQTIFTRKIDSNYILSLDTKKILYQLKQLKPSNISMQPTEFNQWLINKIAIELTIEENQRIFSHISLNVQSLLLNHSLNFDPSAIQEKISLINNQWSKIFQFGRARFPKPIHGFIAYSQF